MANPLVECIPNFSEGRRPEVIEAIVDAIRNADAVRLLDASSDADHNRSVITFVGAPDAVEKAAFAGIKVAAALINLDEHHGEHPRIGAADVVPLVPLRDVTMADCVAIAQHLGRRVGSELGIPVYLYEAAATRPDGENLENIRRGEYEALREAIRTDPARMPDFGPASLGTAGATVIGARPALIAFNVYLTTADVETASKIAKAIRYCNGGFRYVKALGLLVEGRAQVSMNLTNFSKTPVYRVVETIRREAQRYGTQIAYSELVGLTPEDALIDTARWYMQLDAFQPDQLLERRFYNVPAPRPTIPETPVPPRGTIQGAALNAPDSLSSGSAMAGLAGVLMTTLAASTSHLATEKKGYKKSVEALCKKLLTAIGGDGPETPLRLMHLSLETLSVAYTLADWGNANAAVDAGVIVHIALAVLEGAALNALVNAASLSDSEEAAHQRETVEDLRNKA